MTCSRLLSLFVLVGLVLRVVNSQGESSQQGSGSELKPPGGDNTSPPDGTLTTPPQDTSTPPQDMSNTPPQEISTTPPQAVSNNPPQDTSANPPPDTSTTPPQDTPPAPSQDMSNKPPQDMSTTPPQAVSNTPPQAVSNNPPPDTSAKPPPGTSNTPPAAGTTTAPPGGTPIPPPAGTTTPPPGPTTTPPADTTPQKGQDLALTQSEKTQPLPPTVIVNNKQEVTNVVIVNQYNTLVLSGSPTSVQTACTNYGTAYQAAVSSSATVTFYKTSSVNIVEVYAFKVESLVVQCNTYVKVGGSALVAWQGTLGYICLFPSISVHSIDLLVSLGSRCKVETSITEIFVSIYLSLGRNDRIKFVATIIQIDTLVICINASPQIVVKLPCKTCSSGRRMLKA